MFTIDTMHNAELLFRLLRSLSFLPGDYVEPRSPVAP
jgi:hypothetical protein